MWGVKMLFEALDRMRRNAIMAAIVLIFVGWILIVMPGNLIPFAGGVFGFLLSVYALVKIFNFIASKKALIDCIRLSLGLIAGGMGIMLFTFSGLFEGLLSWLVGIVPTVSGLYGIYHSFVYARSAGRRGWWILTILYTFLLLFGLFVFFNPWVESPDSYMYVIGCVLIYTAIATILSLIWIWPVRYEED